MKTVARIDLVECQHRRIVFTRHRKTSKCQGPRLRLIRQENKGLSNSPSLNTWTKRQIVCSSFHSLDFLYYGRWSTCDTRHFVKMPTFHFPGSDSVTPDDCSWLLPHSSERLFSLSHVLQRTHVTDFYTLFVLSFRLFHFRLPLDLEPLEFDVWWRQTWWCFFFCTAAKPRSRFIKRMEGAEWGREKLEVCQVQARDRNSASLPLTFRVSGSTPGARHSLRQKSRRPRGRRGWTRKRSNGPAQGDCVIHGRLSTEPLSMPNCHKLTSRSVPTQSACIHFNQGITVTAANFP